MDRRAGRITLGDWCEKGWPSTVHLRGSTRARGAAYDGHWIKPTSPRCSATSVTDTALSTLAHNLIRQRRTGSTARQPEGVEHTYRSHTGKHLRDRAAVLRDGRGIKAPILRLHTDSQAV